MSRPSTILTTATTDSSFMMTRTGSSGAAAPSTPLSPRHISSVPHHLLAPFHHIQRQKNSKGVRTKMIKAFNDWIQLTAPSETKVDAIVGMLHNASLMVDDIEDGATLRRGQPVAHMVFGTALTLNCANHVYFSALADVMRLVEVQVKDQQPPPAAEVKATAQANLVKAYTDELQELHIGQGLDIFWRDTYTCPTLVEYEGMVVQKTGGLFRLSLKLMLALRRFEIAAAIVVSPVPQVQEEPIATATASTGAQKEVLVSGGVAAVTQPLDLTDPTVDGKLIALVNSFSIFFQVLDDYNNLRNEEYHKNKSFCEDLTEGKFSFLITHSILTAQATGSGDTRLYHALRQRPSTDEMKKFCLELMEETQSFDFCKERLRELKSDILTRLKDLGGNPKLERCLAELEQLGGL